MKSIARECFIIALLFIIVVMTIGMSFYRYMPNNKTVPEAVTYTADSETTATLQEISVSSASYTTSSDGETESVLKSYSISATDLSTEAANGSYTSGKTDPFAEYVATEDDETTDEDGTSSSDSSTSTSSSSSSNSSSSSSSTTGTFFENSSSK